MVVIPPLQFHLVVHVYKVTIFLKDRLYTIIILKWDYDKDTIIISVLGFVQAAIHKFQHSKPSRLQDFSYPWLPQI